jgi:DNA-nicking Smr family endonuclease
MKKDTPILDLHGLAHKNVLNELINFYFWEGNNNSIIITGKSNKMKEIVVEWLEENGFYYETPINNEGRIVVYVQLT